jgi:hypothetical protein
MLGQRYSRIQASFAHYRRIQVSKTMFCNPGSNFPTNASGDTIFMYHQNLTSFSYTAGYCLLSQGSKRTKVYDICLYIREPRYGFGCPVHPHTIGNYGKIVSGSSQYSFADRHCIVAIRDEAVPSGTEIYVQNTSPGWDLQ